MVTTDNIRLCDKCGVYVPLWEDAVVLEARATKRYLLLGIAQARHLMPTNNCEGSPTRRQRIEDTPGWREVWEQMQQEFACAGEARNDRT
jgi:hypothetical protein